MSGAVNPELPVRDLDRRRPGLAPLLSLVPEIVTPARSRTPATVRTRIEQLEELGRDLAALLEHSAPDTWRDMRRALWQLIRRARRELRALERQAARS